MGDEGRADDQETFGEALGRLMHEAGVSQLRLGSRRVLPSVVSDWVHGRHLPQKGEMAVRAIGAYLNEEASCDICGDDLLGAYWGSCEGRRRPGRPRRNTNPRRYERVRDESIMPIASSPPESASPSTTIVDDEYRQLADVLGLALAHRGDAVKRREFLTHLFWGGAVLASSALDIERVIAAASGHVDRRAIEDLQVIADNYARWMHTAAPKGLLPQVEHHLAYVQTLLGSVRSPALEGRLHLIGGKLAAVAGRLSFSLGNPGNAHGYLTASETHAREAGDGPLRAYVLGQRSHLYSDLWREGRAAGYSMPLQLLDEAHAVAGGSSSPWLRAWLAVRRAEEHAARGDDRAVYHDLDNAHHLLGTARSTEDGFFAHWYESPIARLDGYRGNCAQLLGSSAQATTSIEHALVALSPSLISVRSTMLADLALAYAKREEIEHACGLLAESLDLCSEGGLVAHVQRVVGVRHRLTRWRDSPAVTDLDEQLHHITWAPV